jgi:hypothetical protein
MNHRVACLMAAGLALAAGPRTVMSAAPVRHPAGSIEILVDGAPRRAYSHQGRWYVEALEGRDYAIRLRNPYGVRVAVALSVDGLNTIDARHTTAASARKWVLGPYETVTISGWQTSRTEARRFVFTTEARSYAQALGQTANLGVISAVFFKERVRPIVKERVRPIVPGANEDAGRRERAPRSSAPAEPETAEAADGQKRGDDDYAATGMGGRTGHAVTEVWLDLEDVPAQIVNLRYEYRPQLVRLGVLPPARTADPLDRRERAHGFEPGFSPEPPGR